MQDATYKAIAAILATDSSVSTEARQAILAFCRCPAPFAPSSTPNRFISPKEVARRLGVSLRSVQRRISTGDLPSKRFGHSRRILESAVDATGVESGGDAELSGVRTRLRKAG